MMAGRALGGTRNVFDRTDAMKSGNLRQARQAMVFGSCCSRGRAAAHPRWDRVVSRHNRPL